MLELKLGRICSSVTNFLWARHGQSKIAWWFERASASLPTGKLSVQRPPGCLAACLINITVVREKNTLFTRSTSCVVYLFTNMNLFFCIVRDYSSSSTKWQQFAIRWKRKRITNYRWRHSGMISLGQTHVIYSINCVMKAAYFVANCITYKRATSIHLYKA